MLLLLIIFFFNLVDAAEDGPRAYFRRDARRCITMGLPGVEEVVLVNARRGTGAEAEEVAP